MKLLLPNYITYLEKKGYTFTSIQTQDHVFEVVGCQMSFYFERGMIEFYHDAWYRITLKIQNIKSKDSTLYTTKIDKLFRDRDGKNPIKAHLFKNEFVVQQMFYLPPEKITPEDLHLSLISLVNRTKMIIKENQIYFPNIKLL